jgi:hypothetical protein
MATNLAHNSHLTAVLEATVTEPNASAKSRRIVFTEPLPAICAFCYGVGMEVILGKGTRCCGCRVRAQQSKLIEAALISRHYEDRVDTSLRSRLYEMRKTVLIKGEYCHRRFDEQ